MRSPRSLIPRDPAMILNRLLRLSLPLMLLALAGPGIAVAEQGSVVAEQGSIIAEQGRAVPPNDSVPQLVSRPTISLSAEAIETIAGGPESWASPDKVGGSIQTMLLLSVISLAPAILLMTTCYIRIIVVLSLLRQAIGLQALPPTQVLTSISLFMTLLVMTPVWTRVYDEAIKPYSDPETEMTLAEAYEAGALPVRQFMSRQIAAAKNHADVVLFYRHAVPDGPTPSSFADIPIRVLLPAFVISELKIAFLMGFSIYLPFLVVDIVVASVTMSMGMFMLPPAMISLPLKLLLFVLVNGWHLVVGMLLASFGPVG
ncbi:Flagellar biosynthetic protein FliP precursor [Stieleria magnilauensis]|uniref:Flagellar biosynthetic protein FliP n=2 Tax=Stieleria magnilauensis TaxID=2527963 RepID=A0ABX5Y0V2_9BACT|nr:Flagellar biosynthetic protein FliP precursor [Planctomycetes bacterium TBK1r]